MNFDVQLLRIHNISWEYNFLNINVDSSLSLTLKKYQIKAKLLFILNQVSFYHFSANDKWIERRFRNLLRNWNFNLLLRKMDNFSRHNDNVVKFIDARKYHQRSTSSIDIIWNPMVHEWYLGTGSQIHELNQKIQRMKP